MLVFEKIILFNSRYLLRPSKEELVTYFSLCSCHTHFELKNMTKILYIGFSKLRDRNVTGSQGSSMRIEMCVDMKLGWACLHIGRRAHHAYVAKLCVAQNTPN